MSCSKGRANPDATTKLRLFSDSGGYCANPECLCEIFIDFDSGAIHVAELAHIIASSDSGPRSEPGATAGERRHYNNLVLLCPRCHTIIDKAEAEYPEGLILQWKHEHRQIIARAFGVTRFATREEARAAVAPLFDENSFIFREYGPMSNERYNPESTLPAQWLRKIRGKIIPNNRRILIVCEENTQLMEGRELELLAEFRQHVDDFEAKHLAGAEENGRMFPAEFARVFAGGAT